MAQGDFSFDLAIFDQLLEVLIEGDAAIFAMGLEHAGQLRPLAASDQVGDGIATSLLLLSVICKWFCDFDSPFCPHS